MSAQSQVTSLCHVAHSGRENLHHFLPVLLRGMLPLFSIMTLWVPRRITGPTLLIDTRVAAPHPSRSSHWSSVNQSEDKGGSILTSL